MLVSTHWLAPRPMFGELSSVPVWPVPVAREVPSMYSVNAPVDLTRVITTWCQLSSLYAEAVWIVAAPDPAMTLPFPLSRTPTLPAMGPFALDSIANGASYQLVATVELVAVVLNHSSRE